MGKGVRLIINKDRLTDGTVCQTPTVGETFDVMPLCNRKHRLTLYCGLVLLQGKPHECTQRVVAHSPIVENHAFAR